MCVPLSSSALRSTKTFFLSKPYARSERKSSLAAVVLPAPGLPVSTTLRQPSSSRGSPPAWTYITLASSSLRNSLSGAMPISCFTSALVACRSARSESRPCGSSPKSAPRSTSGAWSSSLSESRQFRLEMALWTSSCGRCALRMERTSRDQVEQMACRTSRRVKPSSSRYPASQICCSVIAASSSAGYGGSCSHAGSALRK
mmetsp:Transcript_17047/g.42888  ORF Transcript_17047/g.42888 Transcript_17047/m.42888 type:complete len:201 (+) Transcript_17047:737-1339(+)